MKGIFDTVVHNPDVLAAVVFCIAAALGQLGHSVKKWADGSADCPLGWLTTNFRHTVSAVIGNGAGMLIFIQTGVLGPIWQQPNGWWAVFLFGFMNGFSADSALNKATRAQWTDEQRAAAKP